MYLPKHQYKKVTLGELPPLKDSNGRDFTKSSAIKTSANEYYDVPAKDLEFGNFTNAEQLFVQQTTTIEEIPTPPKPTERDYKAGKVDRYFLQNSSTGVITEISKEIFDFKSKNKALYEKVGKLEWKLEGPVNDIVVNGNVFKGASSVNRDSVMELDNIIKGIKDIVTDYSQFVPETPADRMEKEKPTQVSTSFDIPSPSKKL